MVVRLVVFHPHARVARACPLAREGVQPTLVAVVQQRVEAARTHEADAVDGGDAEHVGDHCDALGALVVEAVVGERVGGFPPP